MHYRLGGPPACYVRRMDCVDVLPKYGGGIGGILPHWGRDGVRKRRSFSWSPRAYLHPDGAPSDPTPRQKTTLLFASSGYSTPLQGLLPAVLWTSVSGLEPLVDWSPWEEDRLCWPIGERGFSPLPARPHKEDRGRASLWGWPFLRTLTPHRDLHAPTPRSENSPCPSPPRSTAPSRARKGNRIRGPCPTQCVEASRRTGAILQPIVPPADWDVRPSLHRSSLHRPPFNRGLEALRGRGAVQLEQRAPCDWGEALETGAGGARLVNPGHTHTDAPILTHARQISAVRPRLPLSSFSKSALASDRGARARIDRASAS